MSSVFLIVRSTPFGNHAHAHAGELHASTGVAQAKLRLQRTTAHAKEHETSFVRSASNEGPLLITTYDDIPVKKSKRCTYAGACVHAERWLCGDLLRNTCG